LHKRRAKEWIRPYTQGWSEAISLYVCTAYSIPGEIGKDKGTATVQHFSINSVHQKSVTDHCLISPYHLGEAPRCVSISLSFDRQ